MNDTFYDVSGLSREERRALMHKAFKLKSRWWADKLDCRTSWRRQKVEMTFDEILEHLREKAYVTVIHRHERIGREEHLEVGFRSMEPIDYFLWIIVPIDAAWRITEGLEAL